MRKRSITIKGHRTSISLEPAFWEALGRLAKQDGRSLPDLVAEIDRRRLAETPPSGLASALRVYALNRLGARDET
ncbi:MAG TPA: ribbon-helix-helix domain-containing protein [Parvularculaceae bacterium]|nr:ribbon-helix-helix domain-containing protein [Parvularculaceae bacterium]